MTHAANTTGVYIVDQDESKRESLSRLMRSVGLHLHSFSSVEEFLAKADANTHGCILLNMAMLPTDLHLEVELKRREIDLPVIAISTQDDAQTRKMAMQLGAQFFFRKPVDDQALLDTIEWVLSRIRNN